jgi:hypothetical protein
MLFLIRHTTVKQIRHFLIFLVALLIFVTAGCVTTPKLTPEDRKRDIQFLADWARDYSPLVKLTEELKGNPSYEALLPQYLAYAEQAESNEEFYRVVRGYYDLICSAGHSYLIRESDLRLGRLAILLGIADFGINPFTVEKARYWSRLSKRHPECAHPPFDILRKEDRYYTDSDWQADGFTVPRGSQIVKVNGLSCSSYLEYLRKDSTLPYKALFDDERARERLLIFNEGCNFAGWQVEFHLPDGSARDAFVPKLQACPGPRTLAVEQKGDCTCIELNDEIGYIRIKAMSSSALSNLFPSIRHKDRKIIKAFLENAHGKYRKLIIDIRNNGGGSAPYVYVNLICPFLDEPAVYEQVAGIRRKYRDGLRKSVLKTLRKWISRKQEYVVKVEEIDVPQGFDPSEWVFYRITRCIEPRHRYDFDGDIYVLTNGGTGSAADDYASAVKRIGFARIVGQSTYGSCAAYIGSPPLQLPASGMIFRVETEIVINPDGSINELFGTPPDIELPDADPPMSITKEELLKDEWVRTVIDEL